ncbi:MAG: hypothetical protein H0X17_13340 [Deltaproteobacteria bacterium]|nr:hypothetical protein [Deltaproteobacteria bacterium]
MRSSGLGLLVAVVGFASAGCGARQRQATAEQQDFDCKERLVSYVVSGHMAASELGVQMDCAEGPRIKRWKVDKQGARVHDDRALTPAEFDRVWREVDGTGWVNLKDCENGSGGKQDPVYVFDIKDDQNKSSFQCQSQSMPYPYNGIVDPLDVAAQQGRGQLGEEPEELKALDQKQPR